MFGLLLSAITIYSADAVLTQGGIVTADSTFTGTNDSGYANCLNGLNDGIFLGDPSQDPSVSGNNFNKCCAKNDDNSSSGWMNI